MKKILVGIPCFNCEAQVSRVLNEINSKNLDFIDAILLVDNKSQDKTLKIIEKKLKKFDDAKFILIQNNENYGLGGSHKVIFNYGIQNNFDYVVIIHGDNQAKTEEIANLIGQIELNKDIDAVLGSRFMKNSKLNGYSKIRTMGNIILNYTYTLFKFKTVKDLGSGLNLFNINYLKNLKFEEFDDGFTFNMDLLLNLIDNKKKFCFMPITWSESDQISNAKSINVGFKTLKKLFFKTRSNSNFKYTYKKIY